nr:SDR family oxidoreductase [uncultured Desulfobacter sp.]
MDNNKNQSKSVLITGGSGGVGAATAGLFLSHGHRVMLLDINEDRLSDTRDRLARELEDADQRIKTALCDVTDVQACQDAVNNAVAAFGGLDVLVNTAGVWVEGDSTLSTEKEWDWVMDVNLKGTYFMCVKAIPALKKTKGCIINLSSDAGVLGDTGAAIYCASKGGVNLLTRALALEFAQDLVRVNAVCPSDIMSPMLQYQADTYGEGDPQAYFKDLLKRYPQKDQARFIKPEEIASFIFYLASESARPITGATLSMDYGTTAGL